MNVFIVMAVLKDIHVLYGVYATKRAAEMTCGRLEKFPGFFRYDRTYVMEERLYGDEDA